jgi:VanZ family protein
MFKFFGKWGHQIWLAVSWTVITQVLLSLPGSIFPGRGLFRIPFLDKIAHLVLFGGLVFTWSLYIYFRKRPPAISLATVGLLIILTFAYGIAVEFFQKNFIPNRSFDRGDILADLGGSLIGYLVTQWFIHWHSRREGYKIN